MVEDVVVVAFEHVHFFNHIILYFDRSVLEVDWMVLFHCTFLLILFPIVDLENASGLKRDIAHYGLKDKVLIVLYHPFNLCDKIGS